MIVFFSSVIIYWIDTHIYLESVHYKIIKDTPIIRTLSKVPKVALVYIKLPLISAEPLYNQDTST